MEDDFSSDSYLVGKVVKISSLTITQQGFFDRWGIGEGVEERIPVSYNWTRNMVFLSQ